MCDCVYICVCVCMWERVLSMDVLARLPYRLSSKSAIDILSLFSSIRIAFPRVFCVRVCVRPQSFSRVRFWCAMVDNKTWASHTRATVIIVYQRWINTSAFNECEVHMLWIQRWGTSWVRCGARVFVFVISYLAAAMLHTNMERHWIRI